MNFQAENEGVKARLAEALDEPIENIYVLEISESSAGAALYEVLILFLDEKRWIIEGADGELKAIFQTYWELPEDWKSWKRINIKEGESNENEDR